MNIHDFKKSFYSALVFFGTLVVLSVGYSLVGSLSTADKVGSGSGLTATSWNRIIDGVLDLDMRMLNLDTKVSNFSFSWGSIGIGISPSAKLDVNGILHANVINTDSVIWGNGALQMLATASCVAKSPSGWVAAYKRGAYATCNARCAATGNVYYNTCRGEISVRGYQENAWVNAISWWWSCGVAEYPNYDEFYCCCSY